MDAHVIDSALFRNDFSTGKTRALWSARAVLQSWLDVEAALARAEAAAGLVPEEAAREITRVADAALYDLDALREEMERTAHPIVPVVRAMAALCTGEAGGWVHWGATTQDITDTGNVLLMKGSLELIGTALEAVTGEVRRLAVEHRDTVMAGRTHGQQALPLTFGFKAAVWLDELQRHAVRLAEARPRLLVGQFAGAVGTMASIGEAGPQIQRAMMQDLGLGVPAICWQASRDRMAEYAFLLALVTGSMGHIAREVACLQRSEIAELEEPNPKGKVGSSTMPHKRNPHTSENVGALARLTRATVVSALDGVVCENERDWTALQSEREFLARLSCHAHAALVQTHHVLEGLSVRTGNMRRNLELTGGMLLSEAVMLALGQKLGRQDAHDVVYDACMKAFETETTMKTALLDDPRVTEHFDEAAIDALINPEAYTGLAGAFVDSVTGG
ncbi:3-carboxy-cis,cis-muconate cycloisomerase [bacterium BMS3Bbin10]|nr:3-carboxy-cis,cis-muconate cycloisomerase [bacterium BMS3Bbin10]